ncbi:hypothetical protein [Haliovirga abyssi]|uniref:Uncharacterized protein n=1 Tax=Haliovirga abyssi TaxID=2996794 RepID=A0AAU9DGJ9_9FUSO|nr:hypothetical protein [Haliovirga abyssi]BDU49814.1 hypothetical protein HLVA_03830 [Haliovirga abyssi]
MNNIYVLNDIKTLIQNNKLEEKTKKYLEVLKFRGTVLKYPIIFKEKINKENNKILFSKFIAKGIERD